MRVSDADETLEVTSELIMNCNRIISSTKNSSEYLYETLTIWSNGR